MMGGRRCGKTSALASLFDQMIHGKTNEFLTVCDKTVLEEKDGEKQDSLTGKRLELEHFISKGKNNTFLADKNPTKITGNMFSSCKSLEPTSEWKLNFLTLLVSSSMQEENTTTKQCLS